MMYFLWIHHIYSGGFMDTKKEITLMNQILLQTTGKRIADLRKKRELSQAYVADAVGVATETFNKWENDKQRISSYNLERLASFFNVTVDYLKCSTPFKNKNNELEYIKSDYFEDHLRPAFVYESMQHALKEELLALHINVYEKYYCEKSDIYYFLEHEPFSEKFHAYSFSDNHPSDQLYTRKQVELELSKTSPSFQDSHFYLFDNGYAQIVLSYSTYKEFEKNYFEQKSHFWNIFFLLRNKTIDYIL